MTAPGTDPRGIDHEPVDVVIPVYNRAGVVVETVASAVAQTWPAVQVYVVDDGSTDDTPAVVDELAATHDNVTALHQPNGGCAAARNAGFVAGDAPYVTFCDSDDVMAPDRVARCVAHLRVNPATDVVLGTQDITVADGITPGLGTQAEIDQDGPRWYSMTFMARRPALAAVGGFDETLDYCEDLDVLARLRLDGATIDYIDHVLVERRIIGDNMVLEGRSQRQELLSLARRLTDRRRR